MNIIIDKPESKSPEKDLLISYDKVFQEASTKDYKDLVSVSLGTGHHGYSHGDIAEPVIYKLKELTSKYKINFTLVLPDTTTYELYNSYYTVVI